MQGFPCWWMVVRDRIELSTFRFSGGRSYQLSYLTWTCGNSLIVIRRPARSPGVGFGPSRARDGHAVVGRTLKSGKSQGHDRILAVQTGRNTYD